MGFYLHKSVSVGPFRFNLSGSGIGMSAGVRGFRVGTGPRGNYVRLGRGGVYYRQTLPSLRPANVQPIEPLRPRVADPLVPDGTHAPLRELASAHANEVVDSSSEELLAEIREKRRKWSLLPLSLVLSGILIFLALGESSWILFPILILCAFAIYAAAYRDKIAKTVVVMYDFEPHVQEAFERFHQWAEAVASSRRTWHIAASGEVYDRKYHAGAKELVTRQDATMRIAAPPFLKTNVPVFSIKAGSRDLYFLPDRMLVCDGAGVGAVTYATLSVSASEQRFIETGSVPSDATVVGHTWRYVNRNGGPDRRFNVNPQIPICAYDELQFTTGSGLRQLLQISRNGLAPGFASAVQHLGTVT